jgi:hypothetical protein
MQRRESGAVEFHWQWSAGLWIATGLAWAPARTWPTAERRQLTLLFCDLCQSTALSVDSGPLADADGDMIFSSFDTRDVDKSQPDLSCGTHIITGGTGKYKGITGSEPFACNGMPALAGGGGLTSMDIPHNTSWEIKN